MFLHIPDDLPTTSGWRGYMKNEYEMVFYASEGHSFQWTTEFKSQRWIRVEKVATMQPKISLLLSIHIRGGQLFFWHITLDHSSLCVHFLILENIKKKLFCTYRTTKLHILYMQKIDVGIFLICVWLFVPHHDWITQVYNLCLHTYTWMNKAKKLFVRDR